jgi:hypothetical protein
MSLLQIILLISSVLTISVLIAWLDHTRGWQFSPWLNGKVNNPFGHTRSKESESNQLEKDLLIAQLKERVQILEKIVTEPAYELNKKINQL